MRLELTVALPDKPGELLKALEVLASLGCNIVSIVHEREAAVGGGVPVHLTFDLPSHVAPEAVKERLEARGVTVLRLEGALRRARVTALASNLPSTPDLAGLKARVAGLEVEEEPRGGVSIRLTLEGSPSEVHEALRELERRVVERGGLFIPPLEEAEG